MITSFKTILKRISSTSEKNIEEGEFVTVSIGITQLGQIQDFIKHLVAFFRNKYAEKKKMSLKLGKLSFIHI